MYRDIEGFIWLRHATYKPRVITSCFMILSSLFLPSGDSPEIFFAGWHSMHFVSELVKTGTRSYKDPGLTKHTIRNKL